MNIMYFVEFSFYLHMYLNKSRKHDFYQTGFDKAFPYLDRIQMSRSE